jgi:hypothetical protein
MKRHRAILFALYAVGFIALAVAGLYWWFGETKAYRDCVALMWDRKHPAELKSLDEQERTRHCEAESLRTGEDFRTCVEYERQRDLIPPPVPIQELACSKSLSLEELRRADAEASQAKQQPSPH